jgi:hypothetical protein
VVTICTTSLTLNNSTFCPHSIFMCFVWISEQRLFHCTALTGFCNRDGECLLRGTDWVFNSGEYEFLGALKNRKKRQLGSTRLSVRPHGKTRLPLDGFFMEFDITVSSEKLSKNSRFIKTVQERWVLHR